MTVPLQRLTERKREAILQAAIAEFRSSGFEITSMDKIAATAGVSKRTVYNHFPSKEALFAEILNRLWNSITAEQDMARSEEHTSELQSLMRISYAVFCLKKKSYNTVNDSIYDQ